MIEDLYKKPAWKEEDCYIYWDRPLSKMKKMIKKLSPNPSADVLECSSWTGDRLRNPTNSEDIEFLGSITYNQMQNIKHLVGVGSPSRSSYKSHRRGYVFSEKEERLAEQVKEECVDKVCAFVIQGEIKTTEKLVVDEYILMDPLIPDEPFEINCHNEDGRPVLRREFSSLLDVKSFLGAMGRGEIGGDCFFPTIKEVKNYIPVKSNRRIEKTSYDKVKYFQLS